MLIGVTVASIALAAALWLSQPDPQPPLPLKIDLGTMNAQSDTDRWDFAQIDPEISIMDCRIVAKERLDDDRFLLTEECRWKGGGVERRRFLAFRRTDGRSQGWMYRLAESDS